MLLHEDLLMYIHQKKPRLHFGKSFALTRLPVNFQRCCRLISSLFVAIEMGVFD